MRLRLYLCSRDPPINLRGSNKILLLGPLLEFKPTTQISYNLRLHFDTRLCFPLLLLSFALSEAFFQLVA
jgi:hypothetical protein